MQSNYVAENAYNIELKIIKDEQLCVSKTATLRRIAEAQNREISEKHILYTEVFRNGKIGNV